MVAASKGMLGSLSDGFSLFWWKLWHNLFLKVQFLEPKQSSFIGIETEDRESRLILVVGVYDSRGVL